MLKTRTVTGRRARPMAVLAALGITLGVPTLAVAAVIVSLETHLPQRLLGSPTVAYTGTWPTTPTGTKPTFAEIPARFDLTPAARAEVFGIPADEPPRMEGATEQFGSMDSRILHMGPPQSEIRAGAWVLYVNRDTKRPGLTPVTAADLSEAEQTALNAITALGADRNDWEPRATPHEGDPTAIDLALRSAINGSPVDVDGSTPGRIAKVRNHTLSFLAFDATERESLGNTGLVSAQSAWARYERHRMNETPPDERDEDYVKVRLGTMAVSPLATPLVRAEIYPAWIFEQADGDRLALSAAASAPNYAATEAIEPADPPKS